MWTVMLFAAVELLSRPPKALRDPLFLFSLLSLPLPSFSLSLLGSIIIAHMLFQRHPEWNSSMASMAITCSCWGGRQLWKVHLETYVCTKFFFNVVLVSWGFFKSGQTLTTFNVNLWSVLLDLRLPRALAFTSQRDNVDFSSMLGSEINCLNVETWCPRPAAGEKMKPAATAAD